MNRTSLDERIRSALEHALRDDPGPQTANELQRQVPVRPIKVGRPRSTRRATLTAGTVGLAAAALWGTIWVASPSDRRHIATAPRTTDPFVAYPTWLPDGFRLLDVEVTSASDITRPAHLVLERAEPAARLEIIARPITPEHPYVGTYDQPIQIAGNRGTMGNGSATEPRSVYIDFASDGIAYDVASWGLTAVETTQILATTTVADGTITAAGVDDFVPLASLPLDTVASASRTMLKFGVPGDSELSATIIVDQDSSRVSPWLTQGSIFGELTSRDGRTVLVGDKDPTWYPTPDVAVSASVSNADASVDIEATDRLFDSLEPITRAELAQDAARIGEDLAIDHSSFAEFEGRSLRVDRIGTGTNHLLCLTIDDTRRCELPDLNSNLEYGRYEPSDHDGISIIVNDTWFVVSATIATEPSAPWHTVTDDQMWTVQRPLPDSTELQLRGDYVALRPEL